MCGTNLFGLTDWSSFHLTFANWLVANLFSPAEWMSQELFGPLTCCDHQLVWVKRSVGSLDFARASNAFGALARLDNTLACAIELIGPQDCLCQQIGWHNSFGPTTCSVHYLVCLNSFGPTTCLVHYFVCLNSMDGPPTWLAQSSCQQPWSTHGKSRILSTSTLSDHPHIDLDFIIVGPLELGTKNHGPIGVNHESTVPPTWTPMCPTGLIDCFELAATDVL